ncbi:DoxX family membrane protein [Hymenobacter jejuensis]|uniref:DoxX family membrane protein n=1 Tax=Hymenobacter jejuensis TaxID=2502781 RepID=A0A5B8A3L6_9BACT|nr:DoxX family membrane protein [Hymenobacter jejuensis]QDA61225.1 DoxX family membrane protein [Hymenobacter jejuensis]
MKLTTPEQAFVLGRLLMGANMLTHGLVRLPKVEGVRAGMVKMFEPTWLPAALVGVFASALPYIEFGIGLLLILGLFTRYALTAGMLLMIVLVFGTSLREDWNTVGVQMVYGLFFFLLILYSNHNPYSLDFWRRGRVKS